MKFFFQLFLAALFSCNIYGQNDNDDVFFKPSLSPVKRIHGDSSLQKKAQGSTAGLIAGVGSMYNIPGYIFGMEYIFFNYKYSGVGGKYIFFQHRVSLSNSLTIHYFAPTLTLRTGDELYWFYADFSFGLVLLDDYAGYISQDGWTGGAGFGIGSELEISGNKFLGVRLSGLGAILSSYYTNSPLRSVRNDRAANISRIDLAISFKVF